MASVQEIGVTDWAISILTLIKSAQIVAVCPVATQKAQPAPLLLETTRAAGDGDAGIALNLDRPHQR